MIARPQRVTVQEISRGAPRQFVNLAAGPEPNPRRAARTCCQQLGWRPRIVATRPAFYGVVVPRSPADFVAPAFAGTQAARANPPPSSRRHGAWPLRLC